MEGSGWRVEVSGISRQFLEKFPRIFRENFGISGNRTGFTEIYLATEILKPLKIHYSCSNN